MAQVLQSRSRGINPRPVEKPSRIHGIRRSQLIEMGRSAVAAVALVWLAFAIAGITGPLGLAFCSLVGFYIIYGVVCWRLYGILAMKDRLATAAIWSGALVAFVPLVAVILFVIIKGVSVVFADFPHFFVGDFL